MGREQRTINLPHEYDINACISGYVCLYTGLLCTAHTLFTIPAEYPFESIYLYICIYIEAYGAYTCRFKWMSSTFPMHLIYLFPQIQTQTDRYLYCCSLKSLLRVIATVTACGETYRALKSCLTVILQPSIHFKIDLWWWWQAVVSGCIVVLSKNLTVITPACSLICCAMFYYCIAHMLAHIVSHLSSDISGMVQI